MKLTASDTYRFWSNVRRSDGCWEWTGNVSKEGYGRFYLRGRLFKAHRVSYEIAVAALPEYPQRVIDHLCMNRQCVRPDHLGAVSLVENTMRSARTRGHRVAAPSTTKHGARERFEAWSDEVGVRKLAGLLGVDPSHVVRLKRGTKRPSGALAAKIQRLRGIVAVDWYEGVKQGP